MIPGIGEANINMVWAGLVVSELVKNGLNTFFIAPGNRNAPLLAALADNPLCIKKSVMDERAAAFCALGHARATSTAGVLVCTSGTAAANTYPAVIEAARDHLPLVILSADRPPERVFGDANQSIEQTGMFGRFVVHRLNLPCPSEAYSLEALLAGIDYMANRAHEPVHINLPLDNPLVPDLGPVSEALLAAARGHLARPGPFTTYPAVQAQPVALEEVLRRLTEARRGLLVIGRLETFADRDSGLALAHQLGWPVLCDIASGLKWRCAARIQLHPCDHPAALELLCSYDPDVILQLGSGLVSKAYYTKFLPTSRAHLIQVSPRPGLRDPTARVRTRISSDAQAFVRQLTLPARPSSANQFQTQLLAATQKLDQELNRVTPADLLSFACLAELLHRAIPETEALFLGNSLTIRVFDGLLPRRMKAVSMVTQRGVSGIEGHLATSVGYAEGAQCRTTAVMGDIALLHDLNSLLLLSRSRIPVIAVVVNNQGGRIFERLPAAGFMNLLHPWMITPHDLVFTDIARPFGLATWQCATPGQFSTAYLQALALNQSGLIEISLTSATDLAIFRARQAVRLH